MDLFGIRWGVSIQKKRSVIYYGANSNVVSIREEFVTYKLLLHKMFLLFRENRNFVSEIMLCQLYIPFSKSKDVEQE